MGHYDCISLPPVNNALNRNLNGTNIIMYLNVYLFQNKSTGPHEVDFVIVNKKD